MNMIVIILCFLIVLFLITLVVSSMFIKFILEAVPEKDRKKDLPADEEPASSDPVRAKYLENRKILAKIGKKFEETTSEAEITNTDGLKLRARYRMQEKECHDWIISIHGYKESHAFMLPYGAAFYKKGYHVLLPDNRAHGRSEGNYIGMGWLDKEDISEWINWIVEKDGQAKIILHGISMGAATVMMTAGKNLDHVAGYIEDCGYTSVWDIFSCVMKRDYHLPEFPILYCCREIGRRRLKYDFVKASSISQLKKCEKPMLFIHGEQDGFVPTDMVYQVYEAFTGTKDIYVAKNAGHAEAMDYDPDTYFDKIFEFIDTKVMVPDLNKSASDR